MTKLGQLRGIAILAVVAGHAIAYCLMAIGWWGERYGKIGPVPDWSWVGTPGYYALTGLMQFGLFSVPLFLAASGFFIVYAARGQTTNLNRHSIGRLLKGILLPWLAWMAVSAVLYLGTVALSPSGRQLDLAGAVASRAWDYYFIPLLAQMFIISPVLLWFTYRFPIHLLVGTALLEWLASGFNYLRYFSVGSPPLWSAYAWADMSFCRWVFFVALGMVIAHKYAEVHRRLIQAKVPLTIAAASLGLLSIVEALVLHATDHQYTEIIFWKTSTLLYATAVILALVAWEWPKGTIPTTLGKLGARSFAIYLVQPIAIEYAAKAIYHVAPTVLNQPLLFQPLLTAAGLGMPLLLVSVISRSPFRRYQHLLFGTIGNTKPSGRPKGASVPVPAFETNHGQQAGNHRQIVP